MTEGTEGTDFVMEDVSERLSEIQEICRNEGINLVAVATREGLDSGANVLAVGPAKELISMTKALMVKVKFENAKASLFSIFAEGGHSGRDVEVLKNVSGARLHGDWPCPGRPEIVVRETDGYLDREFEVIGISEPKHHLVVGTTAWLERILPDGDYMVRGVSATHGEMVSQIVNPRDLSENKKD